MKQNQLYEVQNGDAKPFPVVITGRDNWAMEQLIAAGTTDCTPFSHPAPRWSHYIWKLRGEGVDIETIHEKHEGEFPGTHARYVLRSKVTPAAGFKVEEAA